MFLKLRAVFSSLIALITVVLLSFNVFAIKIDGVTDEREWKSAEPNVLISSSDISNGNIRFGVVHIIRDEANDKLIFGFKATLSEPLQQGSDYGVGVSFNSDEFIYVRSSGISDYDTSEYGVDGAVASTHEMSFSAEVVVSLKYGLDSVNKLDLRFIDGNSVPTKVYGFPLERVISTTESTTLTHTQPVDRTEKPTHPKTTKRVKRTVYSYEEVTETVSRQPLNTTEYEQNTTVHSERYAEETTVMTLRSLKIQRGFSYAAIAALIILALAICVVVNLKNDKEKSGK